MGSGLCACVRCVRCGAWHRKCLQRDSEDTEEAGKERSPDRGEAAGSTVCPGPLRDAPDFFSAEPGFPLRFRCLQSEAAVCRAGKCLWPGRQKAGRGRAAGFRKEEETGRSALHLFLKAVADEDRDHIHAQDEEDEHDGGAVLQRAGLVDFRAGCAEHVDVIGQGHDGIKDGRRRFRREVDGRREHDGRSLAGCPGDAEDGAGEHAGKGAGERYPGDGLGLRGAEGEGGLPVGVRHVPEGFFGCADNDGQCKQGERQHAGQDAYAHAEEGDEEGQAEEAENNKLTENNIRVVSTDDPDVTSFLAKQAVKTFNKLGTKAIVTDSYTGRTARYVAAFRGRYPVLAICYYERTIRLLALSYGVFPLYQERTRTSREYLFNGLNHLMEQHLINRDDLIAYLGGGFGEGKGTTFLEINRVGEVLDNFDHYTLPNMEDTEA